MWVNTGSVWQQTTASAVSDWYDLIALLPDDDDDDDDASEYKELSGCSVIPLCHWPVKTCQTLQMSVVESSPDVSCGLSLAWHCKQQQQQRHFSQQHDSHCCYHNRFMAPWNLSGTTRVIQYQKKHSPAHTYRGHQSSVICFLLLLRSVASSLFNLRAWQSFCTISDQVFFGLPLGLAPSTSHSIHFFTQSLSSCRSRCPYTIATCFPVVPRLCHLNLVSLSTLYLELYLVTSHHTSILPFSSLPSEVPPHLPFLWVRSHFHATYYFAHNRCTNSLSLSMIYPYWYR